MRLGSGLTLGLRLAACAALCGCLDTASLQNDQGASEPLSVDLPNQGAGNGSPPASSGGDGDSSANPTGDGDSRALMGDGNAPADDGDSNPSAGDGDDSVPAGDGDSSAPAGDGDGGFVPMPELFAGTAIEAGCLSNAQAQGEMCGSYFCGVDAATLEKGLDPNGTCGEDNGNLGGVDFVCEGRLVSVVADCARMLKAADIFATNEQLRPRVRDCVYEDTEIKTNVTEPCLECFIDVADCAGTFCLLECANEDGPTCDACRMRNNCEKPLFACAGFPDPL